MNQYLSDKIKVVSFIAIIIVFYIHANLADGVGQTMLLPSLGRKCIAGVFGPCAVPMFYAISGFLFFRGIDCVSDVFGKMKKRVWTLLIPFVIAAIVYPLQPVLKQLLLHTTSERDYLALAQDGGLLYTLRCLFVDSGTGMPWAYHLWFMRDLVIIVALSPLLYYLRHTMHRWLIVLVVALYMLFPQVGFLYASIWFVAGSFFLGELSRLPRQLVVAFVLLFLTLAVWHQVDDYAAWQYVKVLEISCGLASLWCVYDWVVPQDFRLSDHRGLALACQFTFFIYLYHEPMLHTIVKALPPLLGNSQWGYLAAVVLTPLIVAPMGIAVGYVFRRLLPSVYYILTGKR